MSAITQEIGQQQEAGTKGPLARDLSLSQKTISGMGWTIGTQIPGQASRFLISVILARLLSPADFGLLGMVIVFTGFAALFSDSGFSSALIQCENIEERHSSSVFWITLLIGIVLACFTLGGAPLVAKFYREPRLGPLMAIIALSFPLTSLGVVQKAILTRAMNFRLLGLIEISTVLVSGILAIVLALRGFGVWSLVWQLLLSAALLSLGYWFATRWRPRFILERRAIADLFGFSANLTGFSVVNYWFRNGDNLLVGKFFGSAPLGVYARAYNLMLLPLSQITWVVARVMFPALSRLQHEKERVRSIFLRMLGIISLITFPLMLGLFAVCDHFVVAVYGPVWREMIPVLRIFCVLGMVQSVTSTIGLIFQSQGRADWMFWWGSFSGGSYIVGIIVGIWMGSLVAVAASLLIVAMILLLPSFSISGKLIGMTLADVARHTRGPLGCSGAMALSVWSFGALLPSGWPHWVYLSIEVSFGIVAYVFLIQAADLDSYQELKSIIIRHLRGTVDSAAVPATS